MMATNLRLSAETARALQDAAKSTGRSQQDLIRDAVERFLGIAPESQELAQLVAAGVVRPGTPFRDVEPWIVLPEGVTSEDLLDRDDNR